MQDPLLICMVRGWSCTQARYQMTFLLPLLPGEHLGLPLVNRNGVFLLQLREHMAGPGDEGLILLPVLLLQGGINLSSIG